MIMKAIQGKRKVGKNANGKAKSAKPIIRIDYPKEGEEITSPQYTFRIGVSAAVEGVEIAINDKPGRNCRESCGYWWYDWSGYKTGEYQVVARVRAKGGKEIVLRPQQVQVKLR